MAPQSPPPLLLFLDFDSTLTTTPTLPLITSIATHPSPHPKLPSLSHAYIRDLTAHDLAYRPSHQERNTVAQELAYLDSLKPVERRSIERVEAADIFRGVGSEDVDAAARRVVGGGDVRLRGGWKELVDRVQRGGGRVAIVSVAWSRRFIYGVLCAWAAREGGRGEGEGLVGDVQIRANEIVEGGLDRVFGAEEGGIWTAGDKERVMGEIIGEEAAAAAVEGDKSVVKRTMYIGDSATDLACLLKADVGICIRDGAMTGEQRDLQGTLERVGVECLHVGKFKDERVEDDGGRRLWWARDFEEVCQSGVTGELPIEKGNLMR